MLLLEAYRTGQGLQSSAFPFLMNFRTLGFSFDGKFGT